MPYRGKPSTGCGECRKRRSRCDKALPSCGQCIKTNRPCPGYRNTTDLMFHDQSTQIVKKVTGSTSFSLEQSKAKPPMPLKMTTCIMSPSLEELGVNFFMSDLVAGDPNLSQLYYIPPFYAKKGFAHHGLHHSITATGLASYARATGRKDIVEHAIKSYISAVRGINEALSNPKTAAEDSTLLCIYLAAMFEVLAAPQKDGQDGQDNCMKHMEGAVAVALIHVKQGQQTEITQKILSTLLQGLVFYTWLNNRPLPPGLIELQGYSDPNFYASPMHYTCIVCIRDVVDFRHALQVGKFKDPISIIHKGLALDLALDEFIVNMPAEARFDTFQTSKDGTENLVYEGYFHSYSNPFLTHTWNVIRTASIHIRRVILQQCHLLLLSSSLPNSPQNTFARAQDLESRTKITVYAVEMAATVPQLGGYMDQLLSKHDSPPPEDTTNTSEDRATEPYIGTNISTASMGLAPHITLDSSRASPKPLKISSSSGSGGDLRPPIDSPMQKKTKLIVGPPPTDNVYHVLFQLYHLREIRHLPVPLREWIDGRIDWFESYSTPKALAEQQVISKRFWPI